MSTDEVTVAHGRTHSDERSQLGFTGDSGYVAVQPYEEHAGQNYLTTSLYSLY